MLEQREFEEISIAEITASLGYSTGSFYSAFADKNAFFVALQTKAGNELRQRATAHFHRDKIAPLITTARLERMIDFVVDFFRHHRGHVKSALRLEPSLPAAWVPHKANGRFLTEALVVDLTTMQADRLRFAVQMVFATLVNAVLHDPGPLRLDDDAIADELKKAMFPYLNAC